MSRFINKTNNTIYFCIEKEKDDTPGFRQSFFRIVIITNDLNEYLEKRKEYKDEYYHDWYFRYQDHSTIVDDVNDVLNNPKKYREELIKFWDYSK